MGRKVEEVLVRPRVEYVRYERVYLGPVRPVVT